VASPALEIEISRTPDEDRRSWAENVVRAASERVDESALSVDRWRMLIAQGLGRLDALHLAFAEAGACDILFSTDDQFVRRCGQLAQPGPLAVVNPAEWVLRNQP